MIKIVPSIIPENFNELKDKMDIVNDFVEVVQIDISDGEFAESVTWPYNEGEELPGRLLPYKDFLEIEVDLFVVNPEEIAEAWVKAGAKSVVLHLETIEDPSFVMARLNLQNAKIGLSINPSSKNEILYEWIPEADFVQFMGNDKVGFSGVKLDPNVYDKVRELRKDFPVLEIAVDIGVNFETAPKLVKSGATKLISGTAIFESKNIEEAIKKLGLESF
ncbi:hypothetical protein COV42_02485 [Candidatus Campbellbacteria bacterium CG11_big_fil_rev_8_21_14_0_20_44_21]|uniref:Ribulose-phosphate 3-epimerase n=1 Tax=Candidatus Campbellbacteria bacterium CG22_combo_CG10-13_8_21_14_all_43_18 TaxID=1974530 RepID=A0A2H0DVX0_9BACT|nr:MAG: hypothetical protein COW82_02690 [Candidatus Campbellbacteria bacterium CG22_combo_CG10-13_8_21_14_all_43_18]PIR24120.1 MAG: hypothetical protein COV42_02485 [Candidatus Campbellbacteria bacterium CG11_big_fil_rev_8_21_14_0_20_44_21]